MIFKNIKMKDEDSYKALIKLAEETNVFKACGNPDNPWVIIQFENEMDMKIWQIKNFGKIFLEEINK